MYNNYWQAFGTKACQVLDEKIWPYKHWKLLELVSIYFLSTQTTLPHQINIAANSRVNFSTPLVRSRNAFSSVLGDVYHSAPVSFWANDAKAIYKIYLSQRIVFYIPL